jgi:hypothetical protein
LRLRLWRSLAAARTSRFAASVDAETDEILYDAEISSPGQYSLELHNGVTVSSMGLGIYDCGRDQRLCPKGQPVSVEFGVGRGFTARPTR